MLFQHNVEAVIWKRHSEHAPRPASERTFEANMNACGATKAQVCRAAKALIAVSEADARAMQSLYGVPHVAAVPTGVDRRLFRLPPARPEPVTDLVFLGSMDWRPNIDGVQLVRRPMFFR